jgi:hypothetical protein
MSYTAERQTQLRQARLQLLRNMLGGVCVQCGSAQNLQFDHIDPATKSFIIATNLLRRLDILLREVEKCQLLCVQCHLGKTASERSKHTPQGHGVINTYNKGCRCAQCREANTLWHRTYKVKSRNKYGSIGFRGTLAG